MSRGNRRVNLGNSRPVITIPIKEFQRTDVQVDVPATDITTLVNQNVKNKYAAEKFFSKLFEYNRIELDRKFCSGTADITSDKYTQMKDIMTEIQKYAKGA